MSVGRKKELEYLNERFESNNAELIVLYGRRRLGKTELLTEFCKDKKSIFYACNEYTDKKQLESFTDAVVNFAPELYRKSKTFYDWEDAFSSLCDLKNDRTVVVIDEFPYMCKGNNSIPSVLQNVWDHKLKESNIMLILCGSSMSFMEDELLGAKNPLYGRATGIYKLEPMPFSDAAQFFPYYSPEDKLISYAILGGTPHYLKQFNPRETLKYNVIEKILKKGTVLFGEVEYILHQELREPSSYISIIEAIACGATKYNEICERSKIESSKASIYISNLLELGIIQREFPVTASIKDHSKKNLGEYSIVDPFFRFWFAYAYKYSSELAVGDTEDIWNEIISDDLHNFSSKAFENVCIEYLRKMKSEGRLSFKFVNIGRWWGKITRTNEKGKPYSEAEEIDILAFDRNEKNYIIGECKFKNEPIDQDELDKLKTKNIFDGKAEYYLFSLNGFNESLSKDKVKLVTMSDICSFLISESE